MRTSRDVCRRHLRNQLDKDDFKSILSEWRRYIREFKESMMYNFPYKASIAAACTYVADILNAEIAVLALYTVFSLADFAMGIIVSAKFGTYNPRRLLGWVHKILMQLTVVLLAVGLLQAVLHTSGCDIIVTNWLLLVYILVDFGSIIEKMDRAGWKVPFIAVLILKLTRKNVSKGMAAALNDPEAAADIEDALSHNGKPPPSRRSDHDKDDIPGPG